MESKDQELTELEKEKIRLEVKELKTYWLKKPSYLRVILTAIIAMATICITLTSGILDVKKERLELEKANLSKDIKEFEFVKTRIQDTITTFRDSLRAMRNREIKYLLELKESQQQEERYIKRLSEANEKDQIIEYYKSRLDSLMKLRIFDETFGPSFQ